jgi:hypothetical protein
VGVKLGITLKAETQIHDPDSEIAEGNIRGGGRRWQDGQHHTLRSFVICTPHVTLFGELS